MSPRYAKRRDANHGEIRTALRLILGPSAVVDTGGIGGGYPDLEVTAGGETVGLEIKDGRKSPSRRRLTPAQRERHEHLKRAGMRVVTVKNLDEALEALGLKRVAP